QQPAIPDRTGRRRDNGAPRRLQPVIRQLPSAISTSPAMSASFGGHVAMIGPSTHQGLSTDLGNNNNNNDINHKDSNGDDDINTNSKNKKANKTTDYTNNGNTTTSNNNTNTNNTAIKGNNGNDNNDGTRESSGLPMAKGPYPVGPSSSPSGTVTAPPSPPSARSMTAPARNDPGGDDLELGELLGGELHDFDDEGWSPEDADLMAAFLEDDFSGEMLFGLDTTSSPTAASAVSDQPGSVPSCPMAEFDDHTLDLLASSGVISGAPGVAMPSTFVGAGADASDVATCASDVRAALPRTPTTPPASGPMPVFGLTPPIAPDTTSDTNVPHPPAISSTPAAPFTSTTATPSFAPSPDLVASTAAAATAAGAAAVTSESTTSGLTTPTPPLAATSALKTSGTVTAVTTESTTSGLPTPTPSPAATSALKTSGTSAVTTESTTSGLTTPTPPLAATPALKTSGTVTAVTTESTTSGLTTPTPSPAATSALKTSGTFSAVTTGSTTSGLTTPTPSPAATSALKTSGTVSAVTTGSTTSGLTIPTPSPAATSALKTSGTFSAVTTGSTTSGLTIPTPPPAPTSAHSNPGTSLGRASSLVLIEHSPPSLTAMDNQVIPADTTSDTNVPHPLAISSTPAAPFTMATAAPSSAQSSDSVSSAAVAAKETVAAVAAAAAAVAAAVAAATSAPSKLSTSTFAVSPMLGTPSTSDGIDHALAVAIQALKIADRAADDSQLAGYPETMSGNKQERLTTALAEYTEKMSMAAPRTSATEMMDAALAACMEQLLFLEERTFVEEETAFSDEVAVRADLGRAMMALNDEKKKKRRAEIRAIIGDVRKRRSKRIRSAALSNVRKEGNARPVWDHFSLREMWKAGKIVTL
ncbi:unnamed protein product, partial [Ectocarpus sp. 4 AP-2014]